MCIISLSFRFVPNLIFINYIIDWLMIWKTLLINPFEASFWNLLILLEQIFIDDCFKIIIFHILFWTENLLILIWTMSWLIILYLRYSKFQTSIGGYFINILNIYINSLSPLYQWNLWILSNVMLIVLIKIGTLILLQIQMMN